MRTEKGRTAAAAISDQKLELVQPQSAVRPAPESDDAQSPPISAQEEIAHLKKLVAELHRSNVELNEFASMASHELQEPLRKVAIFSEFLSEDLSGDASDKVRAELEIIRSSSERMRRLIKGMLTLARIGGDQLELSEIDPKNSIINALGAIPEDSRLIAAEFRYQDLPLVIGNEMALTHLYQNLISNALKFASKNRPLLIEFTSELKQGQVILGVKDNGIGVDQKFERSIFKPLERLHSRDNYEGNGLGLTIAKRFTDRLGGKIWLEHNQDAGSHFRFSLLPAAR